MPGGKARFGTVFVNPLYGKEIGRWVAKARDEVAAQRARAIIALLPVRSSTVWSHSHVAGHAGVFMLRGKLSFGSSLTSGTADLPAGQTDAPFASALVIWDGSPDLITRLRAVFADAWYVAASAAAQ